ncbi:MULTISPECIES: hypothetical protein [unclassified Microcoleus]|uniref:hypothetical protein n=1 Tax=unclassified Microcoleus TaxID=2642155 RepID=UPI002FD53C23
MVIRFVLVDRLLANCARVRSAGLGNMGIIDRNLERSFGVCAIVSDLDSATPADNLIEDLQKYEEPVCNFI